MSFKYQFKRISIRASNEEVIGFLMLLIFAHLQSSIYLAAIELLSRTKSL